MNYKDVTFETRHGSCTICEELLKHAYASFKILNCTPETTSVYFGDHCGIVNVIVK